MVLVNLVLMPAWVRPCKIRRGSGSASFEWYRVAMRAGSSCSNRSSCVEFERKRNV